MKNKHIVSVFVAYFFAITCGNVFNTYLYSRLEITYASSYSTLITITTLMMYLTTAMIVAVYNLFIHKRALHVFFVSATLLLAIINLAYPFFNNESMLNISVFIFGNSLVRLLISLSPPK